MIAQTIVLNCISFVFNFDHFFMFISHLYFFTFLFMSNLGAEGGFSLFLTWRSPLTPGKISFRLSSITDIFHTLLIFISVIRMCYDCSMSKYNHVCFYGFWVSCHFGKIYTESIKPFTYVNFYFFFNSNFLNHEKFFWLEILKLPLFAMTCDLMPVTAHLSVKPSCPLLYSHLWLAPFLFCGFVCLFFCLLSHVSSRWKKLQFRLQFHQL